MIEYAELTCDYVIICDHASMHCMVTTATNNYRIELFSFLVKFLYVSYIANVDDCDNNLEKEA